MATKNHSVPGALPPATTDAKAARGARRNYLEVSDHNPEWTMYRGTRDALISRAKIPAAAFDEPARCSANIWRLHDGEISIEVRRTSRNRFLAYLKHPPAEVSRREVERAARRKAGAELQNMTRAMAAWSADASSWRAKACESVEAFLDCIERAAIGGLDPGFRLSDDTLADFSVHMQAIRGLVESGTVVPDPEAREHRVAQLRARVVAADPARGRLLSAVGVRHG